MSKTQDEVEKFLQDLDVITAKKPTRAANAPHSVVHPSVPALRPPVQTAVAQNAALQSAVKQSEPLVAVQKQSEPLVAVQKQSAIQSKNPMLQPALSQQPFANMSVPAEVDMTSMGPSVQAMDMGPPPSSQMGINKQKVKKATHGYVPFAVPVDVSGFKDKIVHEQVKNDSLDNTKNQDSEIWNFSSLWNKASQVAENTARVVAADKITIWLCVEAEQSISRDVLKDFTYSAVNELWLNPVNRICKSLKVHNVNHSDTFISNSLPEAIRKTEDMVTGLQKLSDEQQLSPGVDSNQVAASVILVVQQVCLPVSCTLLDDPAHTFFLVTLVCDTPELGFISCSTSSQSIVKPVGFLKADSIWGLWESSQRVRVLETAVGDILEEFIAKVGHIRQLDTTH